MSFFHMFVNIGDIKVIYNSPSSLFPILKIISYALICIYYSESYNCGHLSEVIKTLSNNIGWRKFSSYLSPFLFHHIYVRIKWQHIDINYILSNFWKRFKFIFKGEYVYYKITSLGINLLSKRYFLKVYKIDVLY